MSDALKTLREIGAQTIHNDTHISKEYIQAIIHETFDGLQSIQFMGFVSILEREYKIDLNELREKGREHFKDEVEKLQKSEKVFVTTQQVKNYSKVYIALGLALVLSFAYISSVMQENQQAEIPIIEKVEPIQVVEKKEVPLEEPVVEEKKVEVLEAPEEIVEVNTTKEIVTAVVPEVKKVIEPVVKEVITPEVVEVKSLKILPKRKIWAGYINMKTHKKYQSVYRKEHSIDVKKDWLLLFGAGTAYLEINGEKKKFSSRQNMRFKYVDGVFTKISVTEFKRLNKGRKW